MITREINGLRGHPTDMLWDPKTGDFHNPNSWWGEYGAPWQHDAGYVTREDPFYWMVEWATPKNINYFTFGGCYGNQPQPFTPWAVEYWDGEQWVELASGAGTDREAGEWQYDSEGRTVDFVMSEKCVSGSGRFLQIIARVLQMELEDIGPLSLKSKETVDFTTSCAVFAESEAISRLSEGASREDILAGVHTSTAAKIFGLVI